MLRQLGHNTYWEEEEVRKMSEYSLEIPAKLIAEAQKLAADRQISLSQWVTSAIEAAVEAEENRRRIESYARNVDYEKFDAILARVPDVPPIEGDEILD